MDPDSPKVRESQIQRQIRLSHVSGYVFGLYRCQSALLAVDGYLVRGEERGLNQG